MEQTSRERVTAVFEVMLVEIQTGDFIEKFIKMISLYLNFYITSAKDLKHMAVKYPEIWTNIFNRLMDHVFAFIEEAKTELKSSESLEIEFKAVQEKYQKMFEEFESNMK